MILMYHNVVPETAPAGHRYQSITLMAPAFARQVRFLRRWYDVLPLEEYVSRLRERGSAGGGAIAITFDDGTALTYETIRPVLLELRIPATIFVSTCQVDGGPLIWGSYLNALCYEGVYDGVEHEGRWLPLTSDAEKEASRSRLIREARASGDPVEAVEAIRRRYPLPPEIEATYTGMTSDQLRDAARGGLVTIGAHTVTHPFLSTLPTDDQRRELRESKRVLESATERRVDYFAYPSGDYSRETITLAREAGYAAAFAVRPLRLSPADGFYEIPRVGIFSPSMAKLGAKLLLGRWGKGKAAVRV